MKQILAAMMIVALMIAPISAEKTAQEVEIRGEIQNFTTQTDIIEWNAYNFAAFFYDIDENIGPEKLTILNCSLSDTQRTIPEGSLIYETAPVYQDYELYENRGLTVESNDPAGDSGYYVEGWMAEKYITVDGNADQLVKLLVEFEDDDKKTMRMGEPWQLGGGFTLTAMQIDLEGSKVLFQLTKDGEVLDDEVVSTDSTKQDCVYTYTADIGNEDDVPVFSCYVDAVFRGTDSNIVQIMYVFLTDNNVLEIDSGDSYGIMEVQTASHSAIVLENEDDTVDLDTDSRERIMGNMYFIVADNDDPVLRFYPMVEITTSILECPPCPELNQTPCPEPTPCEPCPTPETIILINETIKYIEVPTEPVNESPGFGAILPLIGLLIVAYFIARQKD